MEITNSQDIIDSRDIIARIEELEELENDGEIDRQEEDELATLRKLEEQAEGYGDWSYGETLIKEDYFEDYAQELAEDIGAIDRDSRWPANCIDWEQAARELQTDYISLDFDGVDYWMRA